jgi:hypothetical protein
MMNRIIFSVNSPHFRRDLASMQGSKEVGSRMSYAVVKSHTSALDRVNVETKAMTCHAPSTRHIKPS